MVVGFQLALQYRPHHSFWKGLQFSPSDWLNQKVGLVEEVVVCDLQLLTEIVFVCWLPIQRFGLTIMNRSNTFHCRHKPWHRHECNTSEVPPFIWIMTSRSLHVHLLKHLSLCFVSVLTLEAYVHSQKKSLI
jgi:hypothetical protein